MSNSRFYAICVTVAFSVAAVCWAVVGSKRLDVEARKLEAEASVQSKHIEESEASSRTKERHDTLHRLPFLKEDAP